MLAGATRTGDGNAGRLAIADGGCVQFSRDRPHHRGVGKNRGRKDLTVFDDGMVDGTGCDEGRMAPLPGGRHGDAAQFEVFDRCAIQRTEQATSGVADPSGKTDVADGVPLTVESARKMLVG